MSDLVFGLLALLAVCAFLPSMLLLVIEDISGIIKNCKHSRREKIVKKIAPLHKAGMYETADIILAGFYK